MGGLKHYLKLKILRVGIFPDFDSALLVYEREGKTIAMLSPMISNLI